MAKTPASSLQAIANKKSASIGRIGVQSENVERKADKRPPSQASRDGKYHLCGYFPIETRSSILMCLAKNPRAHIQDLHAEALDLLFAKYNVPETARGQEE